MKGRPATDCDADAVPSAACTGADMHCRHILLCALDAHCFLEKCCAAFTLPHTLSHPPRGLRAKSAGTQRLPREVVEFESLHDGFAALHCHANRHPPSLVNEANDDSW
jgi:hypothetical protein